MEIRAGERAVRLTNLRKVFWPELGLTKRDLLQYYADVAPVLLPHLRGRAMVMKRYPNGASQPFFFMKRVPEPHPPWLDLCPIEHSSGRIIDFPVVQDLLSLLWVVNLGCIDLNQWYARCDDVDRPDYVHFDLDPVTGATAVPFDRLREAALTVRDALAGLGMPAYVKTTGSRGFHVYVPIVRGPTQKDVWDFAKRVALALAGARPALLTAEYRIPKRPAGRVLVDYNRRPGGGRWRSSIRCGLIRARSCRRPSPGTRSRGASARGPPHRERSRARAGAWRPVGAAPRRQEAGAPPARVLSREGAAVGVIRVGISGWRYGPWRGVWYPDGLAQRRELSSARGTSRPWRSTARSSGFSGPIPTRRGTARRRRASSSR